MSVCVPFVSLLCHFSFPLVPLFVSLAAFCPFLSLMSLCVRLRPFMSFFVPFVIVFPSVPFCPIASLLCPFCAPVCQCLSLLSLFYLYVPFCPFVSPLCPFCVPFCPSVSPFVRMSLFCSPLWSCMEFLSGVIELCWMSLNCLVLLTVFDLFFSASLVSTSCCWHPLGSYMFLFRNINDFSAGCPALF